MERESRLEKERFAGQDLANGIPTQSREKELSPFLPAWWSVKKIALQHTLILAGG
jgi:hypothetical protein